MPDDPRTYVYVLRGKRAGQFGFFRGSFSDREITAFRGAIEKVLVRFSDGNVVMIDIANVREASPLERIMEDVE